MLAFSFTLLAQEQRTEHLKFLDIPITGNYQTMIQKLKGKGLYMMCVGLCPFLSQNG